MLKILKGDYPPISNSYSRELSSLVVDLLQHSPDARPTAADILGSPFIYAKARSLAISLPPEVIAEELRAYARAGVKECWMVLGPEKQVEVYRQPMAGQFAERTTHGPGGQLTSLALPSLTVGLDQLFAG